MTEKQDPRRGEALKKGGDSSEAKILSLEEILVKLGEKQGKEMEAQFALSCLLSSFLQKIVNMI